VRGTTQEDALDSIIDRAAVRRPQQNEKREIAFYVRAKTGPGSRDWSPVGVAFARKNGEPGFTVKLNTLPISGWNGSMVLVPPFVDDEAPIDE
jgi:hypothetical protein